MCPLRPPLRSPPPPVLLLPPLVAPSEVPVAWRGYSVEEWEAWRQWQASWSQEWWGQGWWSSSQDWPTPTPAPTVPQPVQEPLVSAAPASPLGARLALAGVEAMGVACRLRLAPSSPTEDTPRTPSPSRSSLGSRSRPSSGMHSAALPSLLMPRLLHSPLGWNPLSPLPGGERRSVGSPASAWLEAGSPAPAVAEAASPTEVAPPSLAGSPAEAMAVDRPSAEPSGSPEAGAGAQEKEGAERIGQFPDPEPPSALDVLKKRPCNFCGSLNIVGMVQSNTFYTNLI